MKTYFFAYLISLIILSTVTISAQNIYTLAGNGENGDGGPGATAMIEHINATFIDKDGNIYFSDQGRGVIRRIDKVSGIVETIAGNGIPGTFADGVPATNTSLNTPTDIFVDENSNLFLTESNGNRLRKVDGTTGIIETIAGSGSVRGFGGDGGAAKDAITEHTSDLELDQDGNIYFIDHSNFRIRMIHNSTGIIETVAGNGISQTTGDGGLATEANIDWPIDLKLDSENNLYILSLFGPVRKVNQSTVIITSITGGVSDSDDNGDGGPAINANFIHAISIALDSQDNLYIGDFKARNIRKVDHLTGIIETFAGSGNATYNGDGGLALNAGITPNELFFDKNDNLIITDASANRIRKIENSTGIIETIAGGGIEDGKLALEARLSLPRNVCIAENGDIYIADEGNNVIRRVKGDSGIIESVAGNGGKGYYGDNINALDASFDQITGIFVRDNFLYTSEWGFDQKIRKIDLNTEIIQTIAGLGQYPPMEDGVPALTAYIDSPRGLFVDENHNVYVAGRSRISKIDQQTGLLHFVAGNGFGGYSGDEIPALEAGFNITNLTMDVMGNIFFGGDNRIRKIEAETGIIKTIAGTGESGSEGDGGLAINAQFFLPNDVKLDAKGNIYVCSAISNRIRKIDIETGIVTTVGGNGDYDFGGDGGLATDASLKAPRAIDIDNNGNIYIADERNNRVRVITAHPFAGFISSETEITNAAEFDITINFKRNIKGFTADMLNLNNAVAGKQLRKPIRNI